MSFIYTYTLVYLHTYVFFWKACLCNNLWFICACVKSPMHTCVFACASWRYGCTLRVSATLSLSKAIDVTHTYMVFLFMIDTYISTSTRLEECINDACVLHKRAHVSVRLCARASVRDCLGARASAPTVRALFTSAWTACGSTRRRSTIPMRSTRTSARGTPRQSSRCFR